MQEAFGNVAANLPKILAALRLAAGPHVPIVAMNYYNPFLAVWLLGDAELARRVERDRRGLQRAPRLHL